MNLIIYVHWKSELNILSSLKSEDNFESISEFIPFRLSHIPVQYALCDYARKILDFPQFWLDLCLVVFDTILYTSYAFEYIPYYTCTVYEQNCMHASLAHNLSANKR